MPLPNIHILGIQGSGKGTQSKLLVDTYGLTLLPSGNLFRKRAQRPDEFGLRLRDLLRTGELLPDEFLLHEVSTFLERTNLPVGLLGDGVIRTVRQAEELETVWTAHNLTEPFLIHLTLSDAEARSRIAARGIADDIPREDVTEEAINRRISAFHTLTKPVIERFEAAGRLASIDASTSIQDVFAAIQAILTDVLPDLRPLS